MAKEIISIGFLKELENLVRHSGPDVAKLAIEKLADNSDKIQNLMNPKPQIKIVCPECNGKGEKEMNFRVGPEGMQIEMDAPVTCIFCDRGIMEIDADQYDPANDVLITP